jgi:hypothetical protein
MLEIKWTQEKKDAVIKAVNDFLIKNEITCGEDVDQSSKAHVGSIRTMSKIADIAQAEDLD